MKFSYRTISYVFILLVAAFIAATPWVLDKQDSTNQYCAAEGYIYSFEAFKFRDKENPPTDGRKSEADPKDLEHLVKCSDLNAQWLMSDIARKGYFAGLAELFCLA